MWWTHMQLLQTHNCWQNGHIVKRVFKKNNNKKKVAGKRRICGNGRLVFVCFVLFSQNRSFGENRCFMLTSKKFQGMSMQEPWQFREETGKLYGKGLLLLPPVIWIGIIQGEVGGKEKHGEEWGVNQKRHQNHLEFLCIITIW